MCLSAIPPPGLILQTLVLRVKPVPTGFYRGVMNFWYWYLLSAAALSFSGYVILNLLLTAALAGLVHFQARFAASKSGAVTGLKAAALAAAALALLWRESFLPSTSTIISFLANSSTRPSARYILEFLWQSANLPMIFAGIALLALVFFVSRKKPMLLTMSVYSVLAAAWLMQPRQSTAGMGDFTPEAFYHAESGRRVAFSPPANKVAPFDILIIHICSLSWKDLKDADFDIVPFFSKFDYVFTDFSAACTYSGPAAMRVLRAACGQVPQPQLLKPAPAGCYLMDDLRAGGFKTFTMFTHDGSYADFSNVVQKYGHADAPLGIDGLPVEYVMFNGKEMYADNAALHKFWEARSASPAPRAALYYNTANLHIGTHKPGVSRGVDDAVDYKERMTALTAQLEEFFSEVERSGRNAVVLFVPEHGAGLTGTKMQAKDVRDIPIPPIATVPVAVKLIGKSFYPGAGPQVITKPVSMLALAWLMAEFLRNNPYTKYARKPETVAAEIPGTDFMAENEYTAVKRVGLGYFYRLKEGKWAPLPVYADLPPGTIPAPGDFMRKVR